MQTTSKELHIDSKSGLDRASLDDKAIQMQVMKRIMAIVFGVDGEDVVELYGWQYSVTALLEG